MTDRDHQAEAEHITAESVQLDGGSAYVIKAGHAHMNQSAASTVYAKTLDVREGAVGWAESDLVRGDLSAVGFARAETVVTDQSVVGVTRASNASIANSLTGVVVAERAEFRNSRAIVLLAREASGSLYTLLDTRGAAFFGLMTGVALGAMWLLGSVLGRKQSE